MISQFVLFFSISNCLIKNLSENESMLYPDKPRQGRGMNAVSLDVAPIGAFRPVPTLSRVIYRGKVGVGTMGLSGGLQDAIRMLDTYVMVM